MSLFSSFLSKLKPKSNSVLGIDVGASSIKVVQLGKKGDGAILETYGEISLGSYAGTEIGRATNLPFEKLAEALIDVLRESKTTTMECGISIPIVSSLVSVIQMPGLGDRDLAQMVPIEARKYVPVPISEVTLDWWEIPKEEVSQTSESRPKAEVSLVKKVENTEIMLAVIHNEAITKYENLTRAAGVNSSFLEIEIFSTIRATLDHAANTVAIFDLGAASTKLYIIDKGILRKSHTINRGSQDITLALSQSLGIPVVDAEMLKRNVGYSNDPQQKNVAEIVALTMEYIFSETAQAVSSYQKQTRRSIEKIILTGGGVNLKGFNELAKKTLETPLIVADPYSKVEAPAFLGNVLRSAGPEFAVALGVALRKIQEG